MPNPWDYAKTSEHSHQAALFQWANMACRFGAYIAEQKQSYETPGYALAICNGYKPSEVDSLLFKPLPQLKWLHAIHNQGHGDAIRGGKAKAEGVKAGVFDMFLPVPMQIPTRHLNMSTHYHGLYLELKVGKNQMSPIQAEFAADMVKAGYAVDCAWGWLEAREKILAYLQISC